MIRCDWCTVWYHGDCVNVKEGDYKRGEKYKCNECKDEKRSSNADEVEVQKKEAENVEEQSKQTTKTMTTALLKLNEEVETLRKELQTSKQQQIDEKQEHQQEVDKMKERMQQVEEKNTQLQKEDNKNNTQLEEAKEKTKQQQEENRKLKLEIGKLKVLIKGKEDENKELMEENIKLQREVGIARKETEMMEIRATELQAIQQEKQTRLLMDCQIQTQLSMENFQDYAKMTEEARQIHGNNIGITEDKYSQTEEQLILDKEVRDQEVQASLPGRAVEERWFFRKGSMGSDRSINRDNKNNGKRTKLCRYYGKSTGCSRGDSCWYQHVHSEKQQTRPNTTMHNPRKAEACRFYGKGSGCYRGNRCWYIHETTESQNVKQENKEEKCRYYKKGAGCNRGTNCRYRHEDEHEDEIRHRNFLAVRRATRRM